MGTVSYQPGVLLRMGEVSVSVYTRYEISRPDPGIKMGKLLGKKYKLMYSDV